MWCTAEGTFSLAFTGAAICQRDFLFEGVTLEKYPEPLVGCEYRADCAAAKNLVLGWRKKKFCGCAIGPLRQFSFADAIHHMRCRNGVVVAIVIVKGDKMNSRRLKKNLSKRGSCGLTPTSSCPHVKVCLAVVCSPFAGDSQASVSNCLPQARIMGRVA